MKKLALLALSAVLFAALVACQSGATVTQPKAPVVMYDITKSWTFENTAVWTSTLSDKGVYDGISALGIGIGVTAIPAAQLPKTAFINGKTINLTHRLQLPKLSNFSSGALQIPMSGPCTLVFACLSSGSTAARDLVISNGKGDIFTKTLNMVVMNEVDIVTYNYTEANHKGGDGNVYLYTNDPGGAITLYYIGIAK